MSIVIQSGRFGGAAAFDPTTISGCALWLDASDASSFTFSSGSVVSQWNDKSGNARHASQGTVGNQPSRSGTQNGLSTVVFDGTDDHLSITSFASGFTSGELFLVIKVAADPPGSTSSTGSVYFSDVSGGEQSHYPYTDGVIYDCWGNNARKTVGNPTPSLAAHNVYGVSAASGAWTARLNGSSLFTTGTNTVNFSTNAHFIGASQIGPAYFLNGEIAAVVMYNTALGNTDRQTVEAGLKSRWGTP